MRAESGFVRKGLCAAVAVLAAVLIFKKTVYDRQPFSQSAQTGQEGIEQQVAQIEEQMDELKAEQEELRSMIE